MPHKLYLFWVTLMVITAAVIVVIIIFSFDQTNTNYKEVLDNKKEIKQLQKQVDSLKIFIHSEVESLQQK